jgi:adenylate cyclase, class 2
MTAVREVEVKYRIRDAAALESNLTAHGIVLSAPVHQDDQAYAPREWRYGMSKIGVPFARLRTQNGRHVFTVKRPVENEMSCLEYETEVSDREQMHGAILAMGFVPTVRIVKNRRTARSGELSVCLDEVDHAGVFLEIEAVIGPGRTGLDVQSDLDTFAARLSVDGQRVSDTYDSLIRESLVDR